MACNSYFFKKYPENPLFIPYSLYLCLFGIRVICFHPFSLKKGYQFNIRLFQGTG